MGQATDDAPDRDEVGFAGRLRCRRHRETFVPDAGLRSKRLASPLRHQAVEMAMPGIHFCLKNSFDDSAIGLVQPPDDPSSGECGIKLVGQEDT
jgi:hypothetical protein